MVWGLEVESLGIRVQDPELGIWGFGFRVQNSGLRGFRLDEG